MSKRKIGYHITTPRDWDINDNWHETLRKANAHNQDLTNHYRDNRENVRKAVNQLSTKLLQAATDPKTQSEYDKLGRQLMQIRSTAYMLLDERCDAGAAINDIKSESIEIAYQQGIAYYRQAIEQIDSHLEMLDELRKRDERVPATNPALKYDVNRLREISQNLAHKQYIHASKIDLFADQMLKPDYNKPKIAWDKPNSWLIYLIEKLRKDGKCPYAEISKIFNKEVRANQRKNGYEEIDRLLPQIENSDLMA